MLDYKLINYKPTIQVGGQQYIDLMSKVFNDTSAMSLNPIIVNKYYVARPDLISLMAYGDDKYADIICKINGVSNPFELNEDMIIMLPNIEFFHNCIVTSPKLSDVIKDPTSDAIQQRRDRNMQKKKNERRSPNEQTYGDSNFVIDKSLGIVFY